MSSAYYAEYHNGEEGGEGDKRSGRGEDEQEEGGDCFINTEEHSICIASIDIGGAF